tara:strand:- start:1757 stop:1954 length:198 start_codon:yes stop_codon:yes gene_type:complete
VEIEPTSQISWKQVAIQKQTRLLTGAEGETVREAVETIMPVLYTQTGSKVEAQPLASSKRVNVSV